MLDLDLAKCNSEVRKRSAYLHRNSRCLSVMPKLTPSRILQCPSLLQAPLAPSLPCSSCKMCPGARVAALPPKHGSGTLINPVCAGDGEGLCHTHQFQSTLQEKSQFSVFCVRERCCLSNFSHTQETVLHYCDARDI